MGGFLALAWEADDPQAATERAAAEARIAAAGDWTRVHRGPDLAVWRRGAWPLEVRDLGAAVVIGTCLARDAPKAFQRTLRPGTPAAALARTLCDDAWGAFVALLADGPGWAVYRDPSGGLDALTWPVGRLRLITSDARPPPAGLLPDRASLDWSVIASWRGDRSRAAVSAGLEGVEIVTPGCLLRAVGARTEQSLIWRPSRFAARAVGGQDTAGGLVAAVGLAVEGLVGPHARVLSELSGGLDSAIVAAALVGRGLGSRLTTCLNHYGDRPEGDERGYARAVAERLGLPLDCAAKAIVPLTAQDFAVASRGLRPGFAMVDPVLDLVTAGRLRAAGATGLLTGHGGDAVFYQMPTPLQAVDQLRLGGYRSLSPERVGDLARFTRRPAWSILRRLAPGGCEGREAYRAPDLAARDAASGARLAPWRDPWTADCADLPPAKRGQVTAIFRAQLALGWSQRGSAAQVLCPLLTQPVVEYCLGLSVPRLTGLKRDRAFAREAFRDQLPATVIDRRGKGDLTAHYGRTVAASLDVLRPLLLDGCLAEAGLLDRAELAALLTPERLILHRANSEILVAALIESWVRWWQTRVPDSGLAPRPRRGRRPVML